MRGVIPIISLADYLIDRCLYWGIITEEEIEVYSFGLKSLLDIVIQVLVLLISGLLLGQLAPILMVAAACATIKTVIGGWHSNTYIGCLIISSLAIIGGAYAGLALENLLGVQLTLFAASSIVILLFAPADHVNNPIPAEQIAPAKRKIRIRLLVCTIFLFIAAIANLCLPAACVSNGVFLAAVSLLIPNKTIEMEEK